MKGWIFAFAMLMNASAQAAECVKPQEVTESLVTIWYDTLGNGKVPIGSAVVIGPNSIITTNNVAAAMFRGTNATEVGLVRESEGSDRLSMRTTISIAKVFEGAGEQRIYLFKVDAPITVARPATVRERVAEPYERVIVAGHRFSFSQHIGGLILAPPDGGAAYERGLLLIKMDHTVDIKMFNTSADGGGIFDCGGKMIGLITSIVRPFVRYPHSRLTATALPVREVYFELRK